MEKGREFPLNDILQGSQCKCRHFPVQVLDVNRIRLLILQSITLTQKNIYLIYTLPRGNHFLMKRKADLHLTSNREECEQFYIGYFSYFRSPSPHKCLLETSFCGKRPTHAHNLIGPSRVESDDMEKVLLMREADTTMALIPEDIKVPIISGHFKPDPLDKPRSFGCQERKEIFKREVEITKMVLEKSNIQVLLIYFSVTFEKFSHSLLRNLFISQIYFVKSLSSGGYRYCRLLIFVSKRTQATLMEGTRMSGKFLLVGL